MPFNWVDYAIIGIVGLSIVTGIFRGFIKELIALCVWVLAIWLAFRYSTSLDTWLQPYIEEKIARTAAGFVMILIGTLVVGGLVNALLSFILQRSGLSSTDRILGMGFGFVRGVFIVALMMLVVKMTSIPHQDYTHQSQLYTKFDPLVDKIYGYMPQVIQQVKGVDQTAKLIDIGPVVG